MEELNVFGADFLSNGEFHQLYSTFDNQDEICLWDDRISFDFQPKWNCIGDVSSYSSYSPFQFSGHINMDNNSNDTESQSPSDVHILNSAQPYRLNLLQSKGCYESGQNHSDSSNFLTDMDEWKQNHLDDFLYHSNNNNEWELNLDNLLMENPFDDSIFNVCDLPARTLYCNDSCTSFLEETSEHLDTSLRTFQPDSMQEVATMALTKSANCSSTNNSDYKKYAVANTDEKEFICTYGDCRKVYAKAGHLKAHIRRHIGDKPYVCLWPNCTWKFSRSDELSRHRRSHSGIKPYQCDLCPKCFSRSDHLTKHRKVHERKMAAMKIKAVWTKLPPRKPGRKPKSQTLVQ